MVFSALSERCGRHSSANLIVSIHNPLSLMHGQAPAVKLISATCPRCGANLKLPWNTPKAVCEYCGGEVLTSAIADQTLACEACQGYGRVNICPSCRGSGVCKWSVQISSLITRILGLGISAHCDGGSCSVCSGTGRYGSKTCPACNGTGMCPQCLGTGKCVVCHGLGNMPHPNGYEKCSVCHGDGMISPGECDSDALPVVSVCPACKRELHFVNSQCPYCGFVRRPCPRCGAAWIAGMDHCKNCGFGKASE